MNAPSRLWYLAPLAGILLAIAAFAGGLARLASTVDAMPRAVVPGATTVHLDAGGYTLFAESGSVIDGVHYDFESVSLRCHLTDADGTPLDLETSSGSTTYTFDERSGGSVFSVDVPAEGDYRLECASEGDQPAVVAFGQGLGLLIAFTAVGSLVSFFGGFVVAVLVFLRRRRAAQWVTVPVV